jgi:hypothetical protein
MSKDYSSIQTAIADYLQAWAKLKELKVLNTKKDFTSQLGEFIAASVYEGKPSTSSIQKDWDITHLDGRKVQVKSHAKASTNNNRWTPVPYSENAEIDLYTIVVFTEDYRIKHFFETPWEELWALSKVDSGRRFIRWNALENFDRVTHDDFRDNDLIKLFIP